MKMAIIKYYGLLSMILGVIFAVIDILNRDWFFIIDILMIVMAVYIILKSEEQDER